MKRNYDRDAVLVAFMFNFVQYMIYLAALGPSDVSKLLLALICSFIIAPDCMPSG